MLLTHEIQRNPQGRTRSPDLVIYASGKAKGLSLRYCISKAISYSVRYYPPLAGLAHGCDLTGVKYSVHLACELFRD